MIMGAKTPHTKATKRRQELERKVEAVVEKTLGKKVKDCRIFISSPHPFVAGSHDDILKINFA